MESERSTIMVTVARAVNEILDALDVAMEKWQKCMSDEEVQAMSFKALEDTKDEAARCYNACQKLIALGVYEYRGHNISPLWTAAAGRENISHSEIIRRVKERERA